MEDRLIKEMNRVESMLCQYMSLDLTFDAKPGFDRLLSMLQPETSDLTFTNLFMWQDSYGLKPVFLPGLDFWLILAEPFINRGRPFFLPPVGDWTNPEKLTAVLRAMEQVAYDKGFKLWLRRFPQPLADALQQIDPSIQFQADPRTFDYVYRVSDLINLEGRKYHGKRNHLNQFCRKYPWEYQRIDQSVLAECLTIDAEWFNIKDALQRESSDEEKAMALMMNNFRVLGVSGGVLRVDGKIQAIAVGERLTAAMAVVHLEKANTRFDGIYAAINQQFTADFGAGYQFINREEDLGLDGLRQAKSSYHPVRLIEKFNGARPE